MKKAGHQHRSRLNFARGLSSLKTPYCNRNRHTHIGNNLVCTGTTPFFKDWLDVFKRGLSAKNQTRNNKRFFPPSLSIGPRSCS
jgi:hypothetical protein